MAHYKHGKDYYVDTAFLNALNKVKGLKGGLQHMGFGEFVWKGPDGEVDFDRMRGKDFPGQSGRSHKVYDNKGGKLVKAMIKAMENQGLSELVEEDEVWTNPLLTEVRKLAGITPKYHSHLIDDVRELQEKKFKVGDIVRRTKQATRSMGLITTKEGLVKGYQGRFVLIQWQDDKDSDKPMAQAEAGLELDHRAMRRRG